MKLPDIRPAHLHRDAKPQKHTSSLETLVVKAEGINKWVFLWEKKKYCQALWDNL